MLISVRWKGQVCSLWISSFLCLGWMPLLRRSDSINLFNVIWPAPRVRRYEIIIPEGRTYAPGFNPLKSHAAVIFRLMFRPLKSPMLTKMHLYRRIRLSDRSMLLPILSCPRSFKLGLGMKSPLLASASICMHLQPCWGLGEWRAGQCPFEHCGVMAENWMSLEGEMAGTPMSKDNWRITRTARYLTQCSPLMLHTINFFEMRRKECTKMMRRNYPPIVSATSPYADNDTNPYSLLPPSELLWCGERPHKPKQRGLDGYDIYFLRMVLRRPWLGDPLTLASVVSAPPLGTLRWPSLLCFPLPYRACRLFLACPVFPRCHLPLLHLLAKDKYLCVPPDRKIFT